MINTELQKIEGYVSPTDQISKLRYEVENSQGTNISKGNIAINENWSIEDCKLTYGSNIITIFITDVNENVTEHQFKCYNNNAQNSSEVLENQELVNQFVAEDTDKDGLYDFLEAEVMQMNPFSKDSDGDGICDGDEDFDSDGLTNLKEIENEIDLLKEDTDEDSLKDGEEYNELKTNPLEKDSDKDGASDSWEIDNGYDPVKKETIFENRKVLKLEGKIEKVSVKIKSEDGLAAETLSVEAAENVFLNEEVPGYLGTAVEFLSEGNFDNAEVSFQLSDEIVEDGSIEPTIYYFNEEKQLLEEVEGQSIDGNIVSASLSHFSQYMLLDKNEQEEVWEYEFAMESNSENIVYDTVCVVNNSVSIGWNLPTVKMLISAYLVEQLKLEDRIGFTLSYERLDWVCGLTNSQVDLRSCIFEWDKSNRTSLMDETNTSIALSAGLAMLNPESGNVSEGGSVKRIFFYTDKIGKFWDVDCVEKYIEKAKSQKTVIYVIDTGDGYDRDDLERLSEETGGRYFSLKNQEEITEFLAPPTSEDDLDKDSDSDGISDYYEKEITKGNLCLGTGVGLGALSYQNEDSDNDGLLDGEEMEISQGNDSFYIKVKSNPTKQDSDDDGLLDNAALYTGRKKIAPKDPQPLQPNGLKEVWKAQWMEELQGIPYDTIDINWLGRDWFNKNTSLLQKFTAAAGNDILTFKKDNDDMAYHSQQETWQHGWGYNDVYDMVFDIATLHNIRKNKYEFASGEEEYVVWMWLGDYLNLGSGAEVGIYNDPICVPQTSAKHWRSIDFRLKMTLNLYNYYGPEDIENVFCWAPIEYQWWITGFNNNFMNPVAGDMISVGSIDFSGRENMFEGLKSKMESVKDDDKSKKYLIFDEEDSIVWFQWGDRMLKEK